MLEHIARFLGKLVLFGGFGVGRYTPHNVVQQLIDTIQRRKRIICMLSPEGIHKRTEYWYSDPIRLREHPPTSTEEK